jgi:riboflavin synthase
MRSGEPFGGHIVQGHVDGVSTVRIVEAAGDGLRVVFSLPEPSARYVVGKGSITVDGVSLTIAELRDDEFGVALIPHTVASTTFRSIAPGRLVNLEVDVLAKYVERLMQVRS